jgi:hypothetical protein
VNGHRPFSLGGGNGSKCPQADTHPPWMESIIRPLLPLPCAGDISFDKLISSKKAPILDRALIARDAAHIAALARDHPAVPSPS